MTTSTRIVLSSDHAAIALRQAIAAHITARGWVAVDIGPVTAESTPYPQHGEAAAGQPVHDRHVVLAKHNQPVKRHARRLLDREAAQRVGADDRAEAVDVLKHLEGRVVRRRVLRDRHVSGDLEHGYDRHRNVHADERGPAHAHGSEGRHWNGIRDLEPCRDRLWRNLFEAFDYGTSVSLTATRDAGAVFKTWTGACNGQGATCSLPCSSCQLLAAARPLLRRPAGRPGAARLVGARPVEVPSRTRRLRRM